MHPAACASHRCRRDTRQWGSSLRPHFRVTPFGTVTEPSRLCFDQAISASSTVIALGITIRLDCSTVGAKMASHPVTCPVRSLASERRSHAGWGDRMQCTQSFGEHRSGRFSSHPLAGRPHRGQMISSIASPISEPRASVRGEVTASRGPGNILACHLTDKEDSNRVCQYLYLVLMTRSPGTSWRCSRLAESRMHPLHRGSHSRDRHRGRTIRP